MFVGGGGRGFFLGGGGMQHQNRVIVVAGSYSRQLMLQALGSREPFSVYCEHWTGQLRHRPGHLVDMRHVQQWWTTASRFDTMMSKQRG
jgi:hypothetical protein